MENRNYILIFLFMLMAGAARAQTMTSFDEADSIANAQYLAGNWQQLIITGQRALEAGFDSPALRQRLGYARLVTGDYSAALREYKAFFKSDRHNTTARYYAYLCNKYLNQDIFASYHARYLDTSTRKSESVTPFDLISAGFETGVKYNDNTFRGTVTYNRVYLSNRLGWRWQLDQSLAYFDQTLTEYGLTTNNDGRVQTTSITGADHQLEYYGKLSHSLSGNLQLMGAYHYLRTNYEDHIYNNNIALFGLRYSGTHYAIQGDINMGNMIDHHVNQYNGSLLYYPMGNLDFYLMSRASYIDQDKKAQGVFSESIGYKIFKHAWAESSGAFGNLYNYIDADALYIYNAIDDTKLKLGETVFYQVGAHAQVQVNYTYERKDDEIHSVRYNQYSITAGLLWKF